MARSPANPSLLRRFAFDREGHLRGWRLLGLSALVAVILTTGGLVAATLAGAGSPEALAIWATVAFVAIKLPMLGILWWLLGRSEHDGADDTLDDLAAAATLDRLRAAARRATGTDDAWDRLDSLAAEAAFVAAHAPERSDEAALLELEFLAARDRVAPPTPR